MHIHYSNQILKIHMELKAFKDAKWWDVAFFFSFRDAKW
jgi:hypothetical protein